MFILSFAVGCDRPDFFGYGSAPIVIYVLTSKQAACQQKIAKELSGVSEDQICNDQDEISPHFHFFATLPVASKEK
jgi:hypothetical protein